MVNAPCAAAHTRASQARPKPRGAHGPIADPERPPWNAHQLGGSAEPPNSPTPVKWIGQALLTPPASHLSRPVRIRPVASWSRDGSGHGYFRGRGEPRRPRTSESHAKGHFMTGGGRMSEISSAWSASVDPGLQPCLL